MKIITLVDNCVYGHHLKAEHGLSIYIETSDKKILFDTGASDLFIHNAKHLNINIQDIDFLVLSHGHYDHAGGLHAFLAQNKKAKVYCKKEALDPKIKQDKENGILNRELLDLGRFEFVQKKERISTGVFIIPEIPIVNREDTHFTNFEVIRNGQQTNDCFEDEQALVLQEEDGITILSACSHRGITNIVDAAKKHFNGIPLKMVIGGFHVHNASAEKTALISQYFQNFPHTQLGVCHCTGVENYAALRLALGNRVFYNHTGKIIETESITQ